jgi:hypothetical protein
LRGTLTAVICLAAVLTTAAHAIPAAELVAGKRAEGAGFPLVSPFGIAKAAGAEAGFNGVLRSATVLSLDKQALGAVRNARPETMTLALPNAAGAPVVLELVRVEPFAPGFTARTSDGQTIPRSALGEHYRGVVRGEEGSLASISFLNDEIMGTTISSRGNMVLGKLGGANRGNLHVLYPENGLIPKSGFRCATGDDGPATTDEVISYYQGTGLSKAMSEEIAKAVAGANVKIYVEVDYNVYQNKGAGTEAFITGIFNNSATIYANESIPIVMSPMFNWTSKSPYQGGDSSGFLRSFQRNRNSFNGDLGHLVSLNNLGGIAAGFNGFCAANRDDSQCYSGLQSTYSNVPTYSWSVMVFTHEMGHLMGSRHTHACVWNGNNTQIDGCSTPEGTCPQVAYPAGGGTIMSYCHLSGRPGINFNNGFGTQPGNVIRSRFAAASCLTP